MKLFIYSPTHSKKSNDRLTKAINAVTGSNTLDILLLDTLDNFESFLALAGNNIFLIHYTDLSRLNGYNESRFSLELKSNLTILHTYAWDNDNDKATSFVAKALDTKNNVYCFGSTKVLTNFAAFIEDYIRTGAANFEILKGYSADFMNLFENN